MTGAETCGRVHWFTHSVHSNLWNILQVVRNMKFIHCYVNYHWHDKNLTASLVNSCCICSFDSSVEKEKRKTSGRVAGAERTDTHDMFLRGFAFRLPLSNSQIRKIEHRCHHSKVCDTWNVWARKKQRTFNSKTLSMVSHQLFNTTSCWRQ